MKILITGAGGFIGTALSKFLVRDNVKYEIFCLVRKKNNDPETQDPSVSLQRKSESRSKTFQAVQRQQSDHPFPIHCNTEDLYIVF